VLRLFFLSVVCSLFLLSACSPSLYIKESYNGGQVVKLSGDTTVGLSRGENIDIGKILKKEKIKPPVDIAITRVMGTYVLTGKGFKNVWFIQPNGPKSAKFFPQAIPGGELKIEPHFVHSRSHNCALLSEKKVEEVTGKKKKKAKEVEPTYVTLWNVHASGKLARSCSDVIN